MFTKDAITELCQAEAISAAAAAIEAAADRDDAQVALPSDFKLTSLEQFLPFRRRARGAMVTSSLDAFAAYVGAQTSDGLGAVFVEEEAMQAVAVLNLGVPDAPGHADNTATYKTQPTAAWTALQAIANGAPKSQQAAAEWMEDWSSMLECGRDGEDIPVKQAIAAVRKITIEEQRKVESEQADLSASRSTFDQIKASGGGNPLPSWVEIIMHPYKGMALRTFRLRVAVLTDDKAPRLTLRIVKAEEHAEQMASELVGMVKEALSSTGIPALIGTYRPKP